MQTNALVPITQQTDLMALCAELQNHDFVVVDTEFQRETTYWPKLCLLQVAAPGVEGMVDPLSPGLDLSPLIEILTHPARIKVMHSGRQDQEIFVRLTGAPLAPVFDTQIAAMALGLGDQISYNNLIAQVLDLEIDKSSQFTNWAQRPLDNDQLVYALGDVTHLRTAYDIICGELRQLGRSDWIANENRALSDLDLYDTDPRNAWRRLSIRKSHTVYLAILNRLATWREAKAQSADRPRNRILRDEAIQALALNAPDTMDESLKLKGIPRNFPKIAHSRHVLSLVKATKENPEPHALQLGPRRHAAPAPKGATDFLKDLLNDVSTEHNITPRLIANVTDLKRLASGERDLPVMEGWRFDVFGNLAVERLKTYQEPTISAAK